MMKVGSNGRNLRWGNLHGWSNQAYLPVSIIGARTIFAPPLPSIAPRPMRSAAKKRQSTC
jgi:hypothetical protein